MKYLMYYLSIGERQKYIAIESRPDLIDKFKDLRFNFVETNLYHGTPIFFSTVFATKPPETPSL